METKTRGKHTETVDKIKRQTKRRGSQNEERDEKKMETKLMEQIEEGNKLQRYKKVQKK